jgi:hypothetical protein
MNAALTHLVRCTALRTTASVSAGCLAVEMNQFPAPDFVGQRHFDRLIDTTQSPGQRAFELLRAGWS